VDLPENSAQRGTEEHATAHWYEIEFQASNQLLSQGPIGVYFPYLYDGASFFLNGQEIDGIPQTTPNTHVKWERPHILSLPSAYEADAYAGGLRVGLNVLTFRIKPSQALASIRLPVITVGSINSLRERYETRLFWTRNAAQFTSVICFAFGIFSLLIWWRRKKDTVYAAFGLALVFWGVRTLTFVIEVLPTQQWAMWRIAYQAATAGMCVSVMVLTYRVLDIRYRRFELFLIAYALIGPLLLLILGSHWDGWVTKIWMAGFMPLVALFFAALFRAMWERRSKPNLSLIFFVGMAGVAAAHDYFILVNAAWLKALLPQWVGERHFIFTYSVIPVLLSMGSILVNRFVDTLTALESTNDTLDRRVTQRENELKDTYQRLVDMESAKRVTEERDRITQDMHDGMGALLFSTLTQVQRGHLPNTEVADALEQCIAEMRLSIDSLSLTDQDAVSLIGDFRYRWESKLSRLGVQSDWALHLADTETGTTLEHVVQTLKIVQEALTNVIKHANASQVAIKIQVDTTEIKAEVSDNGMGLPAKLCDGGRGLANMKKRAKRMGGTFETTAAASGGTHLLLRIPC